MAKWPVSRELVVQGIGCEKVSCWCCLAGRTDRCGNDSGEVLRSRYFLEEAHRCPMPDYGASVSKA